MPASINPPAAAIANVLKNVSTALDEIAEANRNILVQQKKMQALLAELLRCAQEITSRQTGAGRSLATNNAIQTGQDSASALAQILKLQVSMQRENQVFTSISNVLKTRHDSAKNAINNIR